MDKQAEKVSRGLLKNASAEKWAQALEDYAKAYGYQSAEEAESELITTILSKSRGGDYRFTQMIKEHLLPSPDSELVHLPVLAQAETTDAMFQALILSVAMAHIPPSVADKIGSLIEKRTRVVEVSELAEQIKKMQEALDGRISGDALGAAGLEAV